MSEENVETARRAYVAFNRGDFAGALENVAPEFEWVATGVIPGVKGVYRGPEEFGRFLESFWNEFDDSHIEVNELIEAGDQVLASLTVRGRGAQSGVQTSWDIWHLWTLKDGNAVGLQGFTNGDEALEAAGLSE
jgi:ketosteroid isomerase-like protein